MNFHTYQDLCIEILYRLQEDRNITITKSDDKEKPDVITINENNYNVAVYLKLIPNLLNEALMLLSTSGKYLNKSYDVYIQPCKNMFTGTVNLNHTYSEYIIEIPKEVNSIYYETMGTEDVQLYASINNEKKYIDTFTYDNFITEFMYKTNDPVKQSKLLTKGKYTYKDGDHTTKVAAEILKIKMSAIVKNFRIKTLALYKEEFNDPNLVYEYSPFKKIDLKKELPDFFKLNDTNIFVESNSNLVTYKNTRNYSWEDPYNLILDNTEQAIWRINYFSYPTNLKPLGASDTETKIEVAPEVYPLLLLYIEAKIRFIREMDYASSLLNEFEQKRAELINNQIYKPGVNTYFKDVKGWL